MNNENELTAALATIEKCREVSCCPAGVDLQDHLRQLAAENVAIREQSEAVYAAGYHHGHLNNVDGIAYTGCVKDDFYSLALQVMAEAETPATDSIYAGIKAAIEYPKNNSSSKGWIIDPEFLSRVAERAGAFYGYHPGLEETEAALLSGLDLLREVAK